LRQVRSPRRRSASADIMGNSAVLVAFAIAWIASQLGSRHTVMTIITATICPSR
jgi:hypothetical protein